MLYVRPYGREPSAEEREQLEALRRSTTYVLIGIPGPRRGMRRFGEPLHDRLLKLLPGVDLRIVADRTGDNPETNRP